MNQTIRCESLPFLKANGEAATEAPPCTGENSEGCSEFSELLNAELGGSKLDAEPAEEGEKETEALAVYGVASLLFQVPPPEIVHSKGLEASASPISAKGELTQQVPDIKIDAEDGLSRVPKGVSTEVPEAVLKEVPKVEQPNVESRVLPGEGVQLPDFRPSAAVAEQNVPSVPEEGRSLEAQISEKGPEPAKKSNGMVVAQPPLMLMTSQRDEKALQTEQKLGLEHFEAASFEQPIRVEPLQGKSLHGEKADSSEALTVANEMPQTPRFEVVSGEIEVQPARPVEPATVVEEIRHHVELLKSSTAEKLDVVLRPDAQTELRLQVEKVNGHIHVQVRCDRGDFASLEAHWGTIQNTLAPQGIRVEPLQQGNGAQLQQNGSQNSQNSFGQHSDQREQRPAIFIEQEFTNRKASRPKNSRGSAGRGWQSWA